jgi:alkaline phosphatase
VTLLLRQHIIERPDQDTEELKDWINEHLVIKRLGISDALDVELNALASNPGGALYTFSGMVSLRARIGWSTHGHSAVDVNIYSAGGSKIVDRLRKNVENTDIGVALADYLDVDTKEVTKLLKKAMKNQKRPDETDMQAAARKGFKWDAKVVSH